VRLSVGRRRGLFAGLHSSDLERPRVLGLSLVGVLPGPTGLEQEKKRHISASFGLTNG
jgi:hypothetical protein